MIYLDIYLYKQYKQQVIALYIVI